MQDIIRSLAVSNHVVTVNKAGRERIRIQTQKEFCDDFKAKHPGCGNARGKKEYRVYLRENAKTGFDHGKLIEGLQEGRIGIKNFQRTAYGASLQVYEAGASVEGVVKSVENDIRSMSAEERAKILELLGVLVNEKPVVNVVEAKNEALVTT